MPAELQPPTSLRASAFERVVYAGAVLIRERELGVLLVCFVLLGLGGSFVFPFLSMFATLEVGMPLGTYSAFMTATAVANIAVSTVLARRSDRMVSRRPILVLASLAGVLGYAGYAFARDTSRSP